MKCSVVIPYAFSTESAVRLFHSLENQDFSKSDYELIFVNYGNQDSFEEYVDKHSHHLRVRCISFYGKSVGEAKNLGIRKASGELVIFLNGDEIATRTFISGHYNTYKKVGRPVMQFGLTKQVFEENTKNSDDNSEIIRNGIRYWLTEPEKYGLDKSKSYYYIKDIRIKMMEPYRYEFDKVHYKMIFTQTSNLSIPMECIRRFGGLDEDFCGQDVEDWEFGYRMMKNGVELMYNPQVSVLKLYEKEKFDNKRYSEWKSNLDIMLRKYNDKFLDELIEFKSFFDPVRRERLRKAEPSKNIWLEIYKHIELSAGKNSFAEAN